MTIYDAPFLTPEQRVQRLFEINAVYQLHDKLREVLDDNMPIFDSDWNAIQLVNDWSCKSVAKIEAKYRAIAIQNIVTRKVTSWVA